MTRIKARILAAVLTLATPLAVTPALRAETAAEAGKAHFERGVKQYNLGRFPEAIVEFEHAYDKDPAPILLFNIAQSHRQNGNKERALFFYRRYVEQAPDAPNRADVEQRQKDLAQSLQEEKELKQKPPTEVASASGPGAPGVSPPASSPPTLTQSAVTTAPPSPATARWSVAGYAAPSFAAVSGRDVAVPVMFAARLGGAYAFPLGESARLAVGVDGVLALLPYTTSDAMPRKATSSLPGVLATARYVRDVAPNIAVGGGIGAGVVWWSGLGAGNPFADADVVISGAIPMPTLEVGASGEYAIRPDLFVALSPRLAYSKTTRGLGDSLSALWRLDVNVGAGYRF